MSLVLGKPLATKMSVQTECCQICSVSTLFEIKLSQKIYSVLLIYQKLIHKILQYTFLRYCHSRSKSGPNLFAPKLTRLLHLSSFHKVLQITGSFGEAFIELASTASWEKLWD